MATAVDLCRDEDVEYYDRNGYIVVDGFIDDASIDALLGQLKGKFDHTGRIENA